MPAGQRYSAGLAISPLLPSPPTTTITTTTITSSYHKVGPVPVDLVLALSLIRSLAGKDDLHRHF